MNKVFLSPIEINELDQMIQTSVRKALAGASTVESKESIDLMSLKEACKLLNRTPSWLYKETMHKRIPFSKFGSRLVFSRKQLLVWIELQIVPGSKSTNETSEQLTKAAREKSL